MRTWKKWLVPALFTLASVLSLIPAVVKPVIKGEPLDETYLVIAIMFFGFAVVVFAVGRKSGSASGPPSA